MSLAQSVGPSAALAAASPATAHPALLSLVRPADIVGPADGMDVWDYLAEHIDDFAVAKAIADHFDAFPMALQSMPDLDLLGLYLRAKVTIKRSQIAFAEARRVEEALAGRSAGLFGAAGALAHRLMACLPSLLLAAARGLNGLRLASLANPLPAVAVALLVGAWFAR